MGATACKPLAGAYSACCAKASKYFHNRVIGNLDRVQPHKALARGINEAKRSGDTIEEHARTAAALKRVSDYIEEELENEAAYKRGERPIHFLASSCVAGAAGGGRDPSDDEGENSRQECGEGSTYRPAKCPRVGKKAPRFSLEDLRSSDDEEGDYWDLTGCPSLDPPTPLRKKAKAVPEKKAGKEAVKAAGQPAADNTDAVA